MKEKKKSFESYIFTSIQTKCTIEAEKWRRQTGETGKESGQQQVIQCCEWNKEQNIPVIILDWMEQTRQSEIAAKRRFGHSHTATHQR